MAKYSEEEPQEGNALATGGGIVAGIGGALLTAYLGVRAAINSTILEPVKTAFAKLDFKKIGEGIKETEPEGIRKAFGKAVEETLGDAMKNVDMHSAASSMGKNSEAWGKAAEKITKSQLENIAKSTEKSGEAIEGAMKKFTEATTKEDILKHGEEYINKTKDATMSITKKVSNAIFGHLNIGDKWKSFRELSGGKQALVFGGVAAVAIGGYFVVSKAIDMFTGKKDEEKSFRATEDARREAAAGQKLAHGVG